MVRSTENLNMGGNDIDGIDNVSASGTSIRFEDDIDMNNNDIDNVDRITGAEGYIDLDYGADLIITASNGHLKLDASGDIDMLENIDMNNHPIADVNSYTGGDIDSTAHYPNSDNNHDLGTAAKRWQDFYAVTVHEGDHVFSEVKCELCGQQFKNGEALVSYVLSNTAEGTRCIPVHLLCMNNPVNQTPEKYNEVINNLKEDNRYINPIESHQRITEKDNAIVIKQQEYELWKTAKRQSQVDSAAIKAARRAELNKEVNKDENKE